MNRRNGMWLTVLCILAAGIFTTSVTSSFVRESTEAAMAAVTETEDQEDVGVRGKVLIFL